MTGLQLSPPPHTPPPPEGVIRRDFPLSPQITARLGLSRVTEGEDESAGVHAEARVSAMCLLLMCGMCVSAVVRCRCHERRIEEEAA